MDKLTKLASIVWNNTNKCVDLTYGNLTNGNQVQILTCSGVSTHVWNTGYMYTIPLFSLVLVYLCAPLNP